MKFEFFLKKAEKIVAQYKAQYKGVYEMKGGWNSIRDTLESAAVLGGNYLLPGSSLVTDNLVSKGSQEQLNSTLGKVAQIGTGLGGAGVGSSLTGIPQSIGGAAESSALSSIGNGISNAASSVSGGISNALGLSDTAAGAGAAPWINPDVTAGVADSGVTNAAASAPTTAAAPWVNPDAAVAPGASAASAAPWVNPDATAGVDALGNPIGASAAAPTASVANPWVNPDATQLNVPGSVAGSTPGVGTALSSVASQSLGQPKQQSTLSQIAPFLGPAVSGAGLVASAIEGQQPTGAPSEKVDNTALANQAAADATQGQQLQSYITNGTLPPGAQTGIDQAANSAKASIRSKYASMGMSGSSSEQQELAAVDSNAQVQGEQIAQQLLNSGIQENQLSSQLYQSLLNGTLASDKQLSSAISGFAGSLAGAANPSSGTTIKLTTGV